MPAGHGVAREWHVARLTFCEALCALSFNGNSPNFKFTEGLKAVVLTLMLVVYPLPDKGDMISDKAWEWTVYFCDRRLAMPPLK